MGTGDEDEVDFEDRINRIVMDRMWWWWRGEWRCPFLR
jgi:hypothetical protein